MRFEINQSSHSHAFIISRNDTVSKAVISYLFRLHVLKLRPVTIAVITIIVSKQQFERPKWPFQTQDRHKLVHRSTAKGHERTPYQYYSLYLVILNQIFNLVQRFYHIFDFFFSSSGTKILLLSVC